VPTTSENHFSDTHAALSRRTVLFWTDNSYDRVLSIRKFYLHRYFLSISCRRSAHAFHAQYLGIVPSLAVHKADCRPSPSTTSNVSSRYINSTNYGNHFAKCETERNFYNPAKILDSLTRSSPGKERRVRLKSSCICICNSGEVP
jgi:hypothetical protein